MGFPKELMHLKVSSASTGSSNATPAAGSTEPSSGITDCASPAMENYQVSLPGSFDSLLGPVTGASIAVSGEASPFRHGAQELSPSSSHSFSEKDVEILGFESSNDIFRVGDFESGLSGKATACGAKRKKRKERAFAPLLSTMDEYGRLRFSFERERSNGRLMLKMVRNKLPAVVVRVRGEKGVLRMRMVEDNDDNQGQNTSEEDCEEEER